MKTVYNSHVLKMKDVRLDRDQAKVSETLRSCRGESVIVRLRHRAGTLEVKGTSPDLVERLRQEKVDPALPVDLEIITRRPSQLIEPPLKEVARENHEDRNDFNTLQWNGDRGTGEVVSGSLRHTPMFFRENGMNVDLVDLYRGQSLFLVLNGASLATFDWSQLQQPGILTFGINNGAHNFRPNLWTSVDDPSRFMASIWKDPTMTKFIPMSHFQKPIWDTERNDFSKTLVREFPNVVGYRRNEAFVPEKWLLEDTINWGNHSKRGGGRSVMLAALRIAHLLGFRKVYLLGCDFYMDEKAHYWFPEQRSANAISNNLNSYSLMRGYFQKLQPKFLEAGFEVFNCNPQSKLEAFPFVGLHDALGAAKIDLSPTTDGMYVDRHREARRKQEEKDRAKSKPLEAKGGGRTPAGKRNLTERPRTAPPKPLWPNQPNGVLLEHLLASVESATLSPDPFFHIRLQNVFPEPLYREMLALLPEDRHYNELQHRDAMQSDGHSARLKFDFSARELADLDPRRRKLWSEVRSALMDRRLETAMRTALGPALESRFGAKKENIHLRPIPTLIRDLSGYRIGVHTDIFQKAITSQFYLPEDDSRPELGTTFCRRDDDGKPTPSMTLPFLPRTGYAFAVTKDSLHEVRRLDLDDRPRNSLMLTYYLKVV